MEGSPGEVMSSTALPEQHEDQVKLGFTMIQNAYNGKVQVLEQELRGLRVNCDEQKNQAASLQRKNASLELELVEGHQRAQQLADENKGLYKTVQQLRRQLQRLEGLKKKVMDSISDDTHEIEEPSMHMRSLPHREKSGGAMSLPMAAGQGDAAAPAAPLGTGHWQPTASPPMAGSGHAADGAHKQSYASAPAQPEGGPAVDGKQFFRQARNNLSYEAFNEFLTNIKRLNNQQQSREETLEEARRIFGTELQHLYKEFEQLLNRHSM